ncbi:cyclic AMP-dependent transcription factor ATF-2 [Phlebotomus argentipes]|uniref:cyclic AMP-dependent transcription factor ATF-2 n=1 Tax=Phlebotomus argentipes TaxID=94469 RepID=UPI0028937AB6|nr:cyclic AMP-dependent transcription factor ATF-2 [Phlebotomus argentipes]
MGEEAVNLTVINEEIRTRKHTMRLCLGNDSDDKNSANIVVDQTPTPTRLIRNCEEVGLFEDLKHVNPFEETFRRAVEDAKTPTETNLLLPEEANFESAAKIVSEDTLHTPHIFPSTYFSAEVQEVAETQTKESAVEVQRKRKWMPANWRPSSRSQKPVHIQPKVSTPQIIQPAIILPPTVIVKLNPSSVAGSVPAISIPAATVTQSTASIVKKRLRILCSEQRTKKDVRVEKEVKRETVIEKKDTKNSPDQSNKLKGNNEAVKRYRAKLKSYQDFLKTSNQQLQNENAQLKQQNEKLRSILRKHNISIPEELLSVEHGK